MSTKIQLGVQVVSGPDKGSVFIVKKTAFIGSGPSCTVSLTDPGINIMHARIRVKGDTFSITDLTSEPDMKVNGILAKARSLVIGDKVGIADTVLEIIDPKDVSAVDPASVDVVANEKNSITQIIRSHEDAVQRHKSNAEAPPVEAPVEAVAQTEDEGPTAAADTMKKYRDKALSSEPDESEKKSLWPLLIVIAVVAVVASGVFFINRTIARSTLNDRFHAVAEHSASHPDDVEGTIAAYKAIVIDARGVHGGLAQRITEEIIRLEKESADAEDDLNKLLATLDGQADRLIAAKAFDKAIEVYKVADPVMAKKVSSVREARIKKIHQYAEKHRRDLASGAAMEAEALERAKHRLAKEEWEKSLPEAVNALVTGHDDKAIEIMELVSKIVSIETIAKNAAAVTAVAREVSEAKASAASAESVAMDGLSPAAKAVLAIAKEDFWNARSCLAKMENGDFKQALFKHVRISDREMVAENSAIRKFADIWASVTGEKVRKIEKPRVCVASLRESMKEKSPEEAETIRKRLMACRDEFKDTMFIARYAEVFESLERAMLTSKATGVNTERFFNGKVLQLSGEDVFVELDHVIANLAEMSVGVFSNEATFVSLDRDNAVAVLIDVLAVVPVKVISDKQIMFVSPNDSPVPELGQSVLVRKELSKGKMLLNNINTSSSGVIYHSDFEKSAGNEWRSGRDGRALRVEDGKLIYSPAADIVSKREYAAGSGDIVLKTDPLKGPIKIEFDLIMGRRYPLVITLGDVDFMIGANLHKQSGIFLNGALEVEMEMKPAAPNSPVRVSIERGTRKVSMAVGDQSLSCRIDKSLSDGVISTVKFFGNGQTSLDNFSIIRSGVSAKMSEVAGLGIDSSEVLFIPRKSSMDSFKAGVPVYLSVPSKDKAAKPTIIESEVSRRYGDVVLSSLPDGSDISVGTMVSLSREPVAGIAPEDAPLQSSPIAKSGDNSVVLGSYVKGDASGVVSLSVQGRVPERGYLSAVSDVLLHPETEEPLAAVVSDSVRSIFQQNHKTVSCRFADGAVFSADTSKGVLISSRQLAARRSIDIKGSQRASASVSLSSRINKNSFWQLVSGDWKAKTGRLIAARRSLKDAVPIIQVAEGYAGNSQFDLDFRLGEPLVTQGENWGRNLMVELYFPSRQSGVTFGLDTGKNGVLVTGRTLSLVSDDGVMSLNGALPQGSVVFRETGPDGAPIGLENGADYRLRIRRVGNVLEMLVNGKRLAYVKHDDIRGNAYVRLGGAFGMFSLGRATVRSLPDECVIPVKEPELGEFGYVILSAGNQFLLDSDMNGLEVNGKISVMKLDNIVQGKDSRTLILKQVAQGVVSEIGGRTAKVLVTERSEPVTRGMKVFLGTRPESLILTDEMKRDFNRGF